MEPSFVPIPLRIAPGFFSEETDRGAEQRWKTGNRVRFKNGLPEKMGGWVLEELEGAEMFGVDRREWEWTSLDGQPWTAIGTNKKLYLISRGTRYDITPIRSSVTLTDPFTTTDPLATVLVDHVAHGAQVGDFVRFSGASAVGGITIDGEYEITSVLNGNQYRITHSAPASPSATGGGAVSVEYDINTGFADAAQAHGYGTCTYGTGTYGTARGDCSEIILPPRIWSLDNFGEDLLASPRGGALYHWDRSLGPSSRAVLVPEAPQTIERMFMSNSGDQVILLGAFDDVAGSPDKMLIRTSDTGSFTVYSEPEELEEENNVFEERATTGSRLVTGERTDNGYLVASDTAWYMLLDDPDAGFRLRKVSEGNTPAGPNALVSADTILVAMTEHKFMVWDGLLQELPCDVWGYVFDNEAATAGKSPGINRDQIEKVYGWFNEHFGEVWFLYPSMASTECDRYVCWNKNERIWYYGVLDRTAMSSGGIAYKVPYGSSADGSFYLHETGNDADEDPMEESISSWDIQLEQGGKAMHLSKWIPDFKRLTGTLELTVSMKNRPMQTTYTSKTYEFDNTDAEVGIRLAGRQGFITVGSSELGTSWRMGASTLQGQPDASRS